MLYFEALLLSLGDCKAALRQCGSPAHTTCGVHQAVATRRNTWAWVPQPRAGMSTRDDNTGAAQATAILLAKGISLSPEHLSSSTGQAGHSAEGRTLCHLQSKRAQSATGFRGLALVRCWTTSTRSGMCIRAVTSVSAQKQCFYSRLADECRGARSHPMPGAWGVLRPRCRRVARHMVCDGAPHAQCAWPLRG